MKDMLMFMFTRDAWQDTASEDEQLHVRFIAPRDGRVDARPGLRHPSRAGG